MTAIEKLQQDQGTVTAGQITAYQNAYSNYVTAQAAASQAASAALLNKSTANAQNYKLMQDAIGGKPNATNAQIAAATGMPESVIAGIRSYGGTHASGYNPQPYRPSSNLSVGEGSNPGTITRVIR